MTTTELEHGYPMYVDGHFVGLMYSKFPTGSPGLQSDMLKWAKEKSISSAGVRHGNKIV